MLPRVTHSLGVGGPNEFVSHTSALKVWFLEFVRLVSLTESCFSNPFALYSRCILRFILDRRMIRLKVP